MAICTAIYLEQIYLLASCICEYTKAEFFCGPEQSLSIRLENEPLCRYPSSYAGLLLQFNWRNSSLFPTGTQNKWPHMTQKSLLLPSTAPTAFASQKLYHPCCIFTARRASNFSPSFLLADLLIQTTQLSLYHEHSPALKILSQDRAPSLLRKTPWNTKFLRAPSLECSSTHRYIGFFKLSK